MDNSNNTFKLDLYMLCKVVNSDNCLLKMGSLVAQRLKCLPGMRETRVRSLGWEDPLEKGMATHSSTLAWRIPWGRSLVGYSPWGRKESDTTERLHFISLNLRGFHICSVLWRNSLSFHVSKLSFKCILFDIQYIHRKCLVLKVPFIFLNISTIVTSNAISKNCDI